MPKSDIDAIYKSLDNTQKVALLMIALGQKWATEIMRLLSEEEMKKVSLSIHQMGYVPQELTERVIKEFYEMLAQKTSLSTMGGKNYLINVLEGVMGEEKASKMLDNLLSQEKQELFKVLRQIDPQQLAAYLKKEQPQTIALMMSYLPPQRSGAIVAALTQEMQYEVVVCLAKIKETDPNIVMNVEQALSATLMDAAQTTNTQAEKGFILGGVKAAAEMLANIGKTAEKAIMTKLVEKDSDLAAAIKEMMFVFEDIILLDDKSLQKVLKDVEQNDLILSLKGASDTAREKIFKNISKRAVETIQDELSFMGPVKGSTVKISQQKIINIIRKLDEEGQIVIQSKGGEDEVIS